MSVSMRLEPLGVTLPVADGQSLLEAALAAGIRLRSSCRNGSCRECIAKLEDGRITYRIEWPGLSPDEKLQGWVLPCVAVPQSDVRLRQPFQDADASASMP